MPQPTVPVPAYATQPGFLFHAPLGSAEPTHTVAGGVFTDQWPAAWYLLGATEEGHNFEWSTESEPIEFAEFLDPVAHMETGREGSVSFALGSITAHNLRRSLNGGTLTTSGSTGTTKTEYTPPGLGQSVRAMIGWESQDSTERFVWYQVLNRGTVSIQRRKGTDKATIPVEFGIEMPSSGGQPWKYVAAGIARTGA